MVSLQARGSTFTAMGTHCPWPGSTRGVDSLVTGGSMLASSALRGAQGALCKYPCSHAVPL